jgi:hypothetical protein
MKMSREERRKILNERKQFIRKHGREPGRDDPGFDPTARLFNAGTEEEVRAKVNRAMAEAGTPPEFVYAFNKTGLMLGEENKHKYAPGLWEEWTAAIAEYHMLAKAGKVPN